jgi:hypothetical protein
MQIQSRSEIAANRLEGSGQAFDFMYVGVCQGVSVCPFERDGSISRLIRCFFRESHTARREAPLLSGYYTEETNNQNQGDRR